MKALSFQSNAGSPGLSLPSKGVVEEFQQQLQRARDAYKGERMTLTKKIRTTVIVFIGLAGCEIIGWAITASTLLVSWAVVLPEGGLDVAVDAGVVARFVLLAYQFHKWSKKHHDNPLLCLSQ